MEDSYQSIETISNLSSSLHISSDKFDVFRRKFGSKKGFLNKSLNLSSNHSYNYNSMRNSLRNRISKYSSRSRISKNSTSSLGSSIDYSLNNSLISNPFGPAVNTTENDIDPIILEEDDNENLNNGNNKEQKNYINEYPSQKPNYFLPKFLYFALDIDKQNKILEKKYNEYTNNLEDYYKTIKELEDISINNEQIKNNLKQEKDKRKQLFDEVYKLKSDIETQRTITESGLDMSMNNYSMGYGSIFNPHLTTLSSINNSIRNKTGGLNNSFLLSNFIQSGDLSSQVEQYEDKICKIKLDNQEFLEEYDNLSAELNKNLEINSKLKKSLENIDYNIQCVLNEKKYLTGLIKNYNK
jgi:hypothetical protein